MPIIPGTTINLRPVSGQYSPVLPSRQYTCITVHFLSLFSRPCILPPRHDPYATFYIWSVLLKPYTFFTGTTNTLQWIPSQYTLSPIPFLPDTTIILKSISGTTLQVLYSVPSAAIIIQSLLVTTLQALYPSSQALLLHYSLFLVNILQPPYPSSQTLPLY